jgi:serine/threonine protein kinase/WD40 repeat protein
MTNTPDDASLPDAGRPLLAPLLVEQRRRWRSGERAHVEAYLHAQPALRTTPEAILDLIYNELLLREEDGETPRLEEYLARFPELAAPLRQLFEVDRALLSQGLLSLTLAKNLSVSLTAPCLGSTEATRLPVIAGYEILGVLGQGGTGIVYKAWHEGLKRLVALKRLRGGANSDERTRFRAEAETVARLQHPNIVQIFEVGETAAGDGPERVPFLAMEFVDGGSLDRVLAGTPLPPRDAAGLVAVLARALQHAHAQGVVQRDLKPANILLQTIATKNTKNHEKEEPTQETSSAFPFCDFSCFSWPFLVKISDFGLAKRLDADAGHTQTGAILGTPSYMAPEQAAGQTRAAGPAADVYALGAILYECLTGRPPFKAATVLDTLAQVLADEPVPPRRLQPKVPRDLQTLCLKCLEKDPARRYPSAAALADELRRFLDDRPIRARPVGPVTRLARWCRRNPAWAALAGLAGLFATAALAGGVGFGFHQSQAVERYRAALAEAQKQRRQADRRAAQLALDQGLGLCDRGQVGDGLFVLTRGLEFAPRSDQPQLERVLRVNLAAWSKGLHPLRRQLDIGIPVFGAAYSPDGQQVLIGEDNGNARFWDPTTGQSLGPPLHNDGRISVVAFSPDGRLALTADLNGAVFLWDAVTHLPLHGPPRHEGLVLAAAFRPDGLVVATAGSDKTVRLWSTATGQPFAAPLVHPDSVKCVAFNPDGRFLVTGCMDGYGRLWDTANGTVLHNTPWLNALYGVAFSPDGRTVLTGGADRIVRIWDANLTQVVRSLAPQPSSIKALALTPDGRTLVTVEESFAQVWDVASGRALGLPVDHGGDVTGTAISPDGRAFLTVGNDRTVRFWETKHPGSGARFPVQRWTSRGTMSRKIVHPWRDAPCLLPFRSMTSFVVSVPGIRPRRWNSSAATSRPSAAPCASAWSMPAWGRCSTRWTFASR